MGRMCLVCVHVFVYDHVQYIRFSPMAGRCVDSLNEIQMRETIVYLKRSGRRAEERMQPHTHMLEVFGIWVFATRLPCSLVRPNQSA